MTNTDQEYALELAVHRALTAAGIDVPAPTAPPPTVDPFALPPAVAANELITSAWGNAVVSTLTAHESKLANVLWRIVGGAASYTADANGIFTINHGLPGTPAFVMLTPTGNTSAEQAAKLVCFSRTATYIEVRAYRSDTLAPMANTGMGVSWLCGHNLV